MPGPEAVAPLLIELARAVRAYQFFDEGHATRAHALQKAVGVWASGLVITGELEIEVSETGFALNGVTPILGPALDDLARALHFHSIMGIQIHPQLSPEELRSFVAALAREPRDLAPQGGLRAVLQAEGVRHLALWEIPGAPKPSEAARPAPGPASAPEAAGAAPVAADACSEPPSQLTIDLVRELAELEEAQEVGDYRLAGNRVDSLLAKLLAAKNYVDVYRAALAFARHVGDTEGRSPIARAEAQDHLRSMFRDEGLMGFVIEHAYAPTGLTSVQAVQVLSCIAPQSVVRLLDQHTKGDADVRDQTTAILITMGEEAFPVIVDELESEEPGRARRSARLLGDMQNPSGVEFLADRLAGSDAPMQREVAMALSRIGNNRAVRVLIDALHSSPDLGVMAATALGSCRNKASLRALTDAMSEKQGRHESVRREAMRSLGRMGDPDALPALCEVLDHNPFMGRKKARPLRIAAAQAIAKVGGERAFQALSTHAEGGDAAVSRVCKELLRQVESDS